VRQGRARPGTEGLGLVGLGLARQGTFKQPTTAWRGTAWLGEAWRGRARQGRAWRGKVFTMFDELTRCVTMTQSAARRNETLPRSCVLAQSRDGGQNRSGGFLGGARMAWIDQDMRQVTDRVGFKAELKLQFNFDFCYSSCLVSIVPYDAENRDDETIKFLRIDHGNYRRWRIPGGHLCGTYHLARNLFYYPDNVNEEDIFLMESYVDLLANVIDDACKQAENEIKQAVDRTKQEREYLRQQQAKRMIETSTANAKPATDYLYLIEHQNGLVKIGRSVNPEAREKTLQAEDPRLRLIFSGIGCGCFERRLHKIFSSVRRRGEWFDLEEHHRQWIITFCEWTIGATQNSSSETHSI